MPLLEHRRWTWPRDNIKDRPDVHSGCPQGRIHWQKGLTKACRVVWDGCKQTHNPTKQIHFLRLGGQAATDLPADMESFPFFLCLGYPIFEQGGPNSEGSRSTAPKGCSPYSPSYFFASLKVEFRLTLASEDFTNRSER